MSDSNVPNNSHIDISKDDLWQATFDILEASESEGRIRLTLGRVVPVDITSDGRFLLGVANVFNQNWIERNYLGPIKDVVNGISPIPLDVEIVVDDSLAEAQLTRSPIETRDPAEEVPAPVSSPNRENHFNKKYTFDSFVSGDSNHFALSAAMAVAERPGLKYNPLFIWGGSGLGKTHLLHAIGSYVIENYPQRKVIYTPAVEFMNEFVNSMMEDSIPGFRNKYRAVDVLLIDDIQGMEGKKGSIDQFFDIFNHMTQFGKQVVIASDRPPSDIDMDERLTSRFASGLLADIQSPPLEVRIAILKKFVENERISIHPDAITLIAEKSSGNVREMEGVITRVTAWATLSHRSHIDVDTVYEAASDLLKDRAQRSVTIPAIQKAVCRYYGISQADMVGRKRKQEIVFPRHVAMYLSQELTDNSLPKIGKAFGGKDHTTVIHAAAKIKKMMGSEKEVYAQIQHLTKVIQDKT